MFAVHVAATGTVDALRFVPGRDALSCPLLALHGEDDPLETGGVVQFLHEHSQSPDGTLISVAGAGHCLYAFAHQRDAIVADWFADRLGNGGQP